MPRRLRYELLACGVHGHVLAGTDAASLRAEDAPYARLAGGLRWYRCLRCDDWVVLPPPASPERCVPQLPAEDGLPLRGRPLRDRFVLRAIAVERLLHLLVLGALDAAVFAFLDHRRSLRAEYEHVLADFQGGLGGPFDEGRHGLLSEVDRLFAVSPAELTLLGTVLALYCAVLAVEMAGLWWARRWAEYLTFLETGVLVPFEVYEMTAGVTTLKVCGLLLNLAVLSYLAVAHRLFGLRGGAAAEAAVRARDSGWQAVLSAAPAAPAPEP